MVLIKPDTLLTTVRKFNAGYAAVATLTTGLNFRDNFLLCYVHHWQSPLRESKDYIFLE